VFPKFVSILQQAEINRPTSDLAGEMPLLRHKIACMVSLPKGRLIDARSLGVKAWSRIVVVPVGARGSFSDGACSGRAEGCDCRRKAGEPSGVARFQSALFRQFVVFRQRFFRFGCHRRFFGGGHALG